MTDQAAIEIAAGLLERHEDIRLTLYKCTAGKNTIGVGRNLDDKGITLDEAKYLLSNDIREKIEFLSTKPYWVGLDSYRKAVLIDLAHCVGNSGFDGFRKMNAALAAGNYTEAADQILDSAFAKQTGGRADDLAKIMRRGS